MKKLFFFSNKNYKIFFREQTVYVVHIQPQTVKYYLQTYFTAWAKRSRERANTFSKLITERLLKCLGCACILSGSGV